MPIPDVVKDFAFTFVAMGYIGLGIASAIVYSQTVTNCGLGGSPPLREYILGCAIAYLIIGCLYISTWFLYICADRSGKGKLPLALVVTLGGLFAFCWMIVGAVSLWRDGGDCIDLNYDVWAVGMADVIVVLVFVLMFWLYRPEFK